MRHEEQLKLGTTTTLDEPVSETIVSEIEDMRQDNLSVFSALARFSCFNRGFNILNRFAIENLLKNPPQCCHQLNISDDFLPTTLIFLYSTPPSNTIHLLPF